MIKNSARPFENVGPEGNTPFPVLLIVKHVCNIPWLGVTFVVPPPPVRPSRVPRETVPRACVRRRRWRRVPPDNQIPRFFDRFRVSFPVFPHKEVSRPLGTAAAVTLFPETTRVDPARFLINYGPESGTAEPRDGRGVGGWLLFLFVHTRTFVDLRRDGRTAMEVIRKRYGQKNIRTTIEHDFKTLLEVLWKRPVCFRVFHSVRVNGPIPRFRLVGWADQMQRIQTTNNKQTTWRESDNVLFFPSIL